jgi:hypothetical protein
MTPPIKFSECKWGQETLVTITLPIGHWKALREVVKMWSKYEEILKGFKFAPEAPYGWDEESVKAITRALKVFSAKQKRETPKQQVS